MKVLTNIDMVTNEVDNVVVQPLASAPAVASSKLGQIYYNSTDKILYQFNGTAWVGVGIDTNTTYTHSFGTVSSNSVPLNLVGSDSTTSTVNIAGAGGATLSVSGSTLTITTANTTYTYTGSATATNYTLTITPSSGTVQTVTIPLATTSVSGVVVVDNTMSANSTNPVQNKIIKAYVDAIISANNAVVYKGTVTSTSGLPSTYSVGWLYVVGEAGTYAGQVCEVGDMIIATVARSGSGGVNSDWDVIQTNINGAITSLSGTSPISVSGTGASRTVAHSTSGVTANAYGTTSNVTPAFGATFTVPSFTVNNTGHLTVAGSHTVTIPATVATTSTAGLESAADKTKLDGIAAGAQVNTIESVSATSPIVATTASKAVSLSHASSGATAGTYGDSTTQTPAFGGSFNVNTETVNGTGHVTSISSHSVTIPNNTATSTVDGLMSAADKSKLDGITPGAVNSMLHRGNATIAIGQTSVTVSKTVSDTTTLSINSVRARLNGESVIVDGGVYTSGTTTGNQTSWSVTFSIAQPQTYDVIIDFIYYQDGE
jgi:hypothetical protein